MGTSSARWAPTSRLWRLAKGAATRYLAPEGTGGVTAGEVVARYVAAFDTGPGQESHGLLASFRLTRRAAQNLGAIRMQAAEVGWQAALEESGLRDLPGQPPEILAQALSSALVGPGGDLEAAVARSSMALMLTNVLPGPLPKSEDRVSPKNHHSLDTRPERLVGQFLATALYQRLVLDLGASLEAAADSFSRLQAGLSGLQDCLDTAAPIELAEVPTSPAAWRGLPGWTWVTQLMEGLVARLKK
jgi:hypothetical protein